MEESTRTGAVGIERGEICERRAASAGPGYVYRVKSLTREGIVSRWMEAASAYGDEHMAEETGEDKYAYALGDKVNYFMFPDGRGMILGKAKKSV